jgi:hypothetical protein
MVTSSSTFNFSGYKGGNYFLLYMCLVNNSDKYCSHFQVRQLLVINDQLAIFIYGFFFLKRPLISLQDFKLLWLLANCQKISSSWVPTAPTLLVLRQRETLWQGLAVWHCLTRSVCSCRRLSA